jgi:hypothetical protein
MRLTVFQLIFWLLVSKLYLKYQKLTCNTVLNPSVKLEWFKINDPDFQYAARAMLLETVGICLYTQAKLC